MKSTEEILLSSVLSLQIKFSYMNLQIKQIFLVIFLLPPFKKALICKHYKHYQNTYVCLENAFIH